MSATHGTYTRPADRPTWPRSRGWSTTDLDPEIGTRLFTSPRTIQYPLRKVFIKLDISSRNELDHVLPRDPATVPPLWPRRPVTVGALTSDDWPLALSTGGCERGPRE